MQLVLAPDPVLSAPCAPVTAFDGDLAARVLPMLRVMYDANGRGLAAPQVGWAVRLFVMDLTWKEGAPAPQVFVNPVITAQADTEATGQEQCLSIPDTPLDIKRPEWIALDWQDLDGTRRTGRFDGVAARCIAHERDHLDGILITDWVAA
ncbi:MAG: peptide deformylase [Pseudomonadota bacterium]